MRIKGDEDSDIDPSLRFETYCEACGGSRVHCRLGCVNKSSKAGEPIGSGATLRVTRGNRHHGLNKGEKWRVFYVSRAEGQTAIGVERADRRIMFYSQRIPRYGSEFSGHRGDPTSKVRFCSV